MAGFIAYAIIDSHLDGVSKDTNYGAATSIELGPVFINDKSKLMRGIGNFHVSALKGRTINSAQLEMTRSGLSNPGFDATLRRCTRPADWTEDGVTWNKYDGTNDWTTAGGDVDNSTPTPVSFSALPDGGLNVVTGLGPFVIDAIDNRNGIVSLILRADDEDPPATAWVAWTSKDSADGRWRLRIDHSGAPIGIHAERGFSRGVQRGVGRGGI
jgi:hypothetical protein